MQTRSAILFLLALFIHSVHATDPNSPGPDAVVKRDSENESLHRRAPFPDGPDPLTGLIETHAPSDFDHIARSPTPVSATEPDPNSESELELDSAPAAKAAAKPKALDLRSDSPLLNYEGAEVLRKRTDCPASPQPSSRGCACDGQSLCKKPGYYDQCYFLQSDPESCGTCFNKCGPNQQCEYGTCQCSSESLTACGRKCVDTLNDPHNCGSCGNWCKYPLTCSQGKCEQPEYKTRRRGL